jgi:hypothetical protein
MPKILSALKPLTLLVLALPFLSYNAFAGSNNLPFKANFTTSENLYPTGDNSCPLAGMTTGTGTASHLGKVLLTATDCATPVPGGFQFNQGKLTFTAANGDTLTATYEGSFVALNPGTIFTINHATFVITGGTGRFAGAFGRGELQGTEDIATQPAIGHLKARGTISYPNVDAKNLLPD